MYRYLAGAVAAAFLLSGASCVRTGQADGLLGQGLLQGRGRRAVRRGEEVRGEDQGQGRHLAVLAAGHDPEDGGGDGFRHAAGCRLWRRVRLPGRRQVGLRGQARGHFRHHQSAEGPVRAEHGRDDLPLQRQDQEERLLRLPDEAADHAHPVLDRHAGAGGLQGIRHPEDLEGLLVVLVRQGAGGLPPEDRHAHLRDRPADGRGFQRLVLFVPHLHGRL